MPTAGTVKAVSLQCGSSPMAGQVTRRPHRRLRGAAGHQPAGCARRAVPAPWHQTLACMPSGEQGASQQRFSQDARHSWPQGSQNQPVNTWEFSSLEDRFVPPPSNTPAHEDDVLLFPPRHGMWMLTNRPGIDLADLSAVRSFTQVYVILFGVGQKDTEGIYSLRAFTDDGLPQETIIVFEAEEDAARYAGLLEATMEHVPAVCSIPPAELLDFCMDAGYHCRLEPCGSLLIPPDFNVGVTDWERSMRLRDGCWAVLEAEPDRNTHGSSSQHTCSAVQAPPTPSHSLAAAVAARPSGQRASSLAKYHPTFSEDELAEIRVMLESLLPAGGEEDGQDNGGRMQSSDSWDEEPFDSGVQGGAPGRA